jgi:hypothetical protein
MNAHDRRRFTLAAAFTLVALPAMWILSSGDGSSGDKVEAVATTGAGAATAPPTTKYEPQPPMFVGGDDNPATPPGEVQIAVPPAPGANDRVVKSSYVRYVGAAMPMCTALFAPDGSTLKVTNVDNGQSVTCTNTYGKAVPSGADMVLDTDLYTRIASLADAPVPVRVTW